MNQIPFRNIPQGTSTDGQVDLLIRFLKTYLPLFPSWFNQKSFVKPNESKYTYELCKYLSVKKERNTELKTYPFEFFPETPQNKTRRADVGIHTVNATDTDLDLIYCLEAKRLPTAKAGNKREKEYVIGNLGGIDRFKKNMHGVTDDGRLIDRNGIIAYVEKLTVSHWHAEINKWIAIDTSWGNTELLKAVHSSNITLFESEHSRSGGSTVRLTHFWLSFDSVI